MNKAASILGLVFALSAGGAHAADFKDHMKTTGFTSIPVGHYNYCKTYKSDCNIKSWNTFPVALTRKRWQELVEVNAYSNNTIEPLTDEEIYQVEEYWTYPVSYGDCEDYVLMKRHMLMERGWPASSLLITVVRQSNGEGHAVLTVRTSKGDFVLDNLESEVRLWHETPYKFVKRQATRHSGYWEDIRDERFAIPKPEVQVTASYSPGNG